MRNWTSLVVVALVLAAGVWWAVTATHSGDVAGTPSPGASSTPAATPPGRLDAPSATAGRTQAAMGDANPADAPPATGMQVLRGRLLGRDGKPLAGARVRAVGARAKRDPTAGTTVTTGADGAFSIDDLAPGVYELWTDDGSGDRIAMADAKPGADPIELVRADAPPKGTLVINGRLLDAAGKPIARARVRAVETQPWPGAGPRPGVLTADDGTFSISDLPSQRYQIWANDDGGERIAAWFVAAGLTAFDLKPMKPEPATKAPQGPKVTVLDADGHPVPRADVFVRRGNGIGSFGELRDGVLWRQPNDAGILYEVFRARTADGKPTGAGPVVYRPPDQGPEADETVRLPAGLSIEGRVAGDDGAGVFGVELAAYPKPEGRVAFGQESARVHGRATSAADGTFTLVGLDTGAYVVSVAPLPPFLAPPAVDATAGSRGLDIRLIRGLEADVHVVDPDGKPVGGAMVSVRSTSGALTSGRGTMPQVSDASGVVRFSQLDPSGAFALSAQASARDDLGVAETNPWTVGPTTITLPRAWTIRGVVKRADGATADAKTIVVLRRDASGKWTFATMAKADGSFEFKGVLAGPWTLAAGTSIAGPNGPEVTVTDATADVTLTLDAAGK